MKYRRVLPFGLAIAALSAPAFADPQASDPAAAQTLFYDARNLMKQGKFAEACPKLEESLRLDEGMGTRFNLADCEEHVGHLATAWAGFLEVAGKARAAKQPDREKIARQRASAIEPRLPKLVVDVEPGAPAGLEVKRDGVVVGSAAWGTAIPVDPGQHTIVATAPGHQPWETHVQTPEAKTTRVTVSRDLPAIAAAPAVVPQVVAPAPAAEPQPQPTQLTYAEAPAPNQALRDAFPPPEQEDRGKAQRIVGWTAGGLGLASLGVAGAFGIVSLDKHNSSRSHCTNDVCDSTGAGLREDAIRAGNIATGTAIGGGVGVLLGTVLLLTAPSSPDNKAIRAVPSVAQGYGGLTIQGRLP